MMDDTSILHIYKACVNINTERLLTNGFEQN